MLEETRSKEFLFKVLIKEEEKKKKIKETGSLEILNSKV